MEHPPFGTPKEKNWHVKEQESISSNPYFQVLQSKVGMPNGKDTTYYTVDFKGAGVGIVARRPGEILLIRQYRFIIDQFVWAIPSGGVDRNEDHAAAARRELLEETGYRAASIKKIQSYFPSYGSGNQEFHCYLAEDLSRAPEKFDSNEVLEVRWFPDREVKDMIFAGHMVDGLSLTPLLFLFARENA
jgi:8-oxo-dGTP pyrophosphatase MutT (NUDIX family)